MVDFSYILIYMRNFNSELDMSQIDEVKFFNHTYFYRHCDQNGKGIIIFTERVEDLIPQVVSVSWP